MSMSTPRRDSQSGTPDVRSSLEIENTPDIEKEVPIEPIPLTDTSANDLDAFGPAPDGGTAAWVNATAGFCIFFCEYI